MSAREDYPGQLDMLRGLVATLRAVATHGDLADVRKLLDEHERDEQAALTQGEGSRPADATPTPEARVEQLLAAIRTQRGEWTTRRTQQFFRSLGIPAPLRGTARSDLRLLHALGHLQLHGAATNRRFYTLNTRKDGRS